jgi:sarcosine oxidase subunit gamma
VPDLCRRSPLEGVLAEGRHGLGPPDGPGVLIGERRGLALAQVLARHGQDEAVAAALGVDPAPGLASRTPVGTALWLAPGTWMVVAEDLDHHGFYRSLRDRLGDRAAVVDQSHGRAVLRVAGARAREVLAKGCRLDLHPRVFTPGMCAQTAIAQIGVLLHQCDEIPTYDLYVPAGYARDFLEWLMTSAAEFGFRTERGS